MSQPFVGEIRLFGGNFAPAGWAFCDGQLLPISENETLFALIGTTYGGDGQSTFGLPDLRGRLPLHQGSGFILGEQGGAESVSLTATQIPAHAHALLGTTDNGTTATPSGNAAATLPEVTTLAYGTDAPSTTLHPQSIGGTGGGQPHSNLQPFLCLSFIISLFGIFPQST
ncbi:phage tail protein [Intrasporangium calvum]|uniref:phage tail protein n=1 Tax=Intrasporangium calvum TaxID=53358 RepID=UPI000DF5DE8A|nr:tail fiber protein [Intrasporangium calvum]AXG13605.1 phage tail protein [Intrasporangium calvum]